MFHKELEAYIVAEGLFDDDITEDGKDSDDVSSFINKRFLTLICQFNGGHFITYSHLWWIYQNTHRIKLYVSILL